jgi:hypothetical protein
MAVFLVYKRWKRGITALDITSESDLSVEELAELAKKCVADQDYGWLRIEAESKMEAIRSFRQFGYGQQVISPRMIKYKKEPTKPNASRRIKSRKRVP